MRIYGTFPLPQDLGDYKADLIAQYRADGRRITCGAGVYLRVQQGENCDGDRVLAHLRSRYAARDAARCEGLVGPLSRKLRVAPCS